ncbi:hypothetical protein C3747_28g72 [Trypanosoma cruzi]|uniref:Uncharacterized protein n=2 Tax=Trypanosoma cruzi TaxID=5693 RepID=Q4D5Z2_TRYCC|nr:hypothetical protein, conserved [Trypanosoma cruzi]EAN87942.1 hypothetical protein, conserved [Trypanosoma cruzi]PWV15631.1 hypothetical protein C3747_28g72 [Trypanosoma cruzi]RNC61315.1 hypothetical protein TcCL_ESM01081 [Trypanosoma cruzi]|eukprot:XP_809793.1 hypothetical protein [Trypanosoma cruzi strain CL Brener]
MSDHTVYPKPLVVTEERLKEAREKQLRQQALKEALDEQIAQTRRRRIDHHALSKKNNVMKEDGVRRQYTFTYEDGHGRFIQRDDSPEPREQPTRTITGTSTVDMTSDNATALSIISGHRKPLELVPSKNSQSNSLPPNFSMSTSEANPLVPKRTEHSGQSLPVDSGSSSRKQNGGMNNISPRVRDLFPQGASPKSGSKSAELVDEGGCQKNCLPRNFNLEDVKRLLQGPQASPRPAQPPAGGGRSPFPLRNIPQKHHTGHLPPLDPLEGANGRRKSEEPSTGVDLAFSPPHDFLGAHPPNVKSPRLLKLKQLSTPRRLSNEGRGRPTVNALAPRNGQARVTENTVERLQKELESRDVQMAKMREKEKNWEEQVKQLKIELKSAKKKERDLNRLVKEGPRRAETAPDQPILSPPTLSAPGLPAKKGFGAPSPPGQGKKQKFARSRVFNQQTFRPISAPSDAASSSYVPQEENVASLMQESFKCASVLTRKTAFGLPEENANRPVPIEYEHLLQFVKEQIITQQQADALWRLFSNEEPPLTLLRRQSTVAQPSDTTVITNTDNYLVLENGIENSIYDASDAKRKEKNFNEEIDRKELVCSNGHGHEELELEGDTFETFAELHLEESFSQEEAGDE